MPQGEHIPLPLSSTPRPQLLLQGHRALLRSVQDEHFKLSTCPAEVLRWLEDNAFIEALLDDDNEFQFSVTECGRDAILGRTRAG